MKRQAFILILTLTLFAGKAAAQCVDAGPVMSAICQGGTSAPLGGIFYGDAAGPVWSDGGVGGTFSPNENDLNATWNPPAGFNGTATLTLTASSGSCTPLSASKQIVVNALPVPTISGSASVCQGAAGMTYTTESSMTGYTWSVSAGGTITAGTGTNVITVIWNTSGAQTVSVNYTDGNGCSATSATVYNVTVKTSPVPTINGDASDCAGTTGVNYTTETGMAGYTWTITAGGNITNGSGTKKITVTWNTAGAQTVSVNYTGGNGCTAASPTVYSVTVNPLPIPTITGPATAAVGSTGNVYTTESGMTGYNWTISSGGTITGGSGTNSITVTWNNSGAKTVKVNYTDANGCTAVSATVFNVTVSNSAPVASNVSILGDPRSGLTLYASYVYSDAEGDDEGTSIYQWYTGTSSGGAGSAPIVPATSITYKLTDAQLGKYIGFSVTPVALTGSSPGIMATTVVWAGPVINDPPVASAVSVTGSLNVNGVLTGHYTYSDKEGDIESGSAYQWYSATSIGGTYSAIPLETTINHIIAMSEQGMYFKFYVTPKAATGSLTGATNSSAAFGPANSEPYADNVTVTGTASLGNTLTGHYNYHDADSDPEGTSNFQWYRETTAIPGATSLTYILTSDDVDSRMKFEVTPVSSTGFPDTGNPVQSSFTGVVIDPSASIPTATDVCISGTRSIGQQLTGKYKYVNTYNEQGSIYLWLRGNTVIESGTSDSYTEYTLTSADLNQEIKYAVIPRNKRSQVGDTVFSQTLAIFTLPRLAYSIADSSIVLTADPSGGIFYGEGVSNGEFFPSTLDYTKSPFTVNYQLNINNPSNSCLQNASVSLTVSDVTMYFDSFRDMYCQNGGKDTIYVKKIPSGTTLEMFRLSNPLGISSLLNDSTVVIDPGKLRAGIGQDTLFFYAYSPLTNIIISRPLVIDSIAQVSIRNLDSGAVVCNNIIPYELFVSQPGGAFAGPVVGDIFNPSLTLGDTSVKYTYTTKLGCFSSVTLPVKINPSPVVSFSVADYCIESSTDTTRFINNTTSADPINKWLWQFSEAGGSYTSNAQTPGYLYTTGGLHKVTLTASTVNNCSSAKDTTIDLGVKPVADFYWKSECYHPSDSLMLFDSTYAPSLIVSRSWNFFDGDSLHTVKNPKYPKKTPGYLPIQYIVKTNYANCSDTVTKSVYIRPSVSLATDDYFQNFESGDGGWVKDYAVRNSWSFGKPDRAVINSAYSGNNAWFTQYDINNQKVESSSIISPCFDFDTIQKPMISLMLWKRFDLNRDGAALQYKIGDSGVWQYIGTLNDGIVWYNSTLIKGRPGGDQIGWTAGAGNLKDTAWVESRHKLDELTGNKDVELRIAYGSDGTSQNNDGVAFDDIWIGRRTRGVLLEHFTNNSYAPSSTATALVSALANRDTTDIINIQYHTNFPGSDPYFDDNPADQSARFLFYGLSRAPYSILDGGTGLTLKNYANVYDYLIADIDSNDLARRSLINPSFSITLNATVAGGILSVSGQVKALEAINAENVTIYLAVTEKSSTGPAGANGETEYYNVFRKFIPDAGGINLKKAWAINETYDLTEQTWTIANIPNSADIEVIAFLQNNITKEVYQAKSNLKQNIIVGIENIFANSNGFSLYPNPASGKLTIAFEKSLLSETEIMIYDFKGTVIRSFKAGWGQTELTISDLGLQSGIYLVRIKSGGLDWGYKKLIVSKN